MDRQDGRDLFTYFLLCLTLAASLTNTNTLDSSISSLFLSVNCSVVSLCVYASRTIIWPEI